MKIQSIALKLKDIIGFTGQSLRVAATPMLPATKNLVDENFLNAKKVILSGDFFPTSEKVLKERLLKKKVIVQPQLTQETEILICGKYPNWMLVEEARFYGIKIIFVDKAGELFSRLATNLNKNRAFSYEEPLGV